MSTTYRAYVLEVTKPLAPVIHVAYLRGEKNGDAWIKGRAWLDTERRAKMQPPMFSDEACKTPFALHGEAFTLVKTSDMTTRNAKLDRTALQSIANDATRSAEDRLKAMAAIIGGA